MPLLLPTTTVTIERPPAKVDALESAVYSTVATNVAARVSGISGSESRGNGTTEISDARLLVDVTIDVRRQDRVTDEVTGEVWDVGWVRQKIGMGLDHVAASLSRTKGGG